MGAAFSFLLIASHPLYTTDQITSLAPADFAGKCSCPSRKIPCKHALGLMLMAALTPAGLPVEGASAVGR
ncbi:SWIM zinc finger family protein [bacterium]|nr:SWIM zinc finger family protein [bacterium]